MNESTYHHIQLDYLNLMADGDADMKKTMLGMLLEELPTELDKMKAAISQGDMAGLSAISHKLKSTLSFVGNPILDKTNKEVEKIAKGEQDAQPLPSHLQAMEEECQQVLPEIQRAMEEA